MIRQLVLFAIFSLLAVLRAAPIPSPDHTHGDYVSVRPSEAENAHPHSSSGSHAGVVVGGPNEHNHYQVAVISHNPPGAHHDHLPTIHPTSGMHDAANSRIGTGRPMEFHANNINHMNIHPPSLSRHETTHLQSTIHGNGHATWPVHNAAPATLGHHTLAGAAHAVHGANSLLHRISTGPAAHNNAHHNPPSPGSAHGSHPPSPANSHSSHGSSHHSLAGVAHAVHAGNSLLHRLGGHAPAPAAHNNAHHNAAASSSHGPGHHTLAGAAHAVHAGNSLLHRISGHTPPAHNAAHNNAHASSSHHGAGGHQVGGGHQSTHQAARQGRKPNPMAGARGAKGGGRGRGRK